MPLVDDDDDDDDGCWSTEDIAVSTTPAHTPSSPPIAILAPYEHPATPHPSPSQHVHSTLPVSHRSQTPAILGSAFGILIAFVAFGFTARYVIRRHRLAADPFRDPPKPGFTSFRFRRRSTASKKRLSDESWVSPVLGSPGSTLSQDLELHQCGFVRRKLVPVTTPVCTPIDTEFGSRPEFANWSTPVTVPLVRVPSPVYISPFSPSPSLSSSSSSLSPTPSTDPLGPPSPNPARLSRLLSSTFKDTRVAESPARPSTAHLIQTARAYAHAYRPSSTTNVSLYTPPTRQSGTCSRTSFYPGATVGDTFSTVTTADTDTVCTVPHLVRAVDDVQPSISPFADPDPGTGVGQSKEAPVGTQLGLKVRLSDASEHAHYRARERERERKRQREREEAEQRQSTDSAVHRRSRSLEMEETRTKFKLRDSESVLREIGW